MKRVTIKNVPDFMNFFETRIASLESSRRYGTALNYQRAKRSLERFLKAGKLTFPDITPAFIESYEEYLMGRGLIKNSISFHLRILRAVYNKGVKQGYAPQNYPFRESYTGIDKTRKRHIDSRIIKSLAELELPPFSRLELARDMFLFSFYTRGMAFTDMCYLKKSDIFHKEIIYVRKKSKSLLKVKIEKPIRRLIERYNSLYPDSPYLFPILEGEEPEDNHRKYLKELSLYNHQLGKLSKLLGLEERLTSYTSRHTWAFLVYNMEIPVSVISAALGHSSEKVTRCYLDSLDNSLIDRANNRLLKRVLS